jgi:hypothetical protein
VHGPRCRFFVFFHYKNFSTTSNYTIVKGDYMSLAGPYSVEDGSRSVIIIVNKVCDIACPDIISWISK